MRSARSSLLLLLLLLAVASAVWDALYVASEKYFKTCATLPDYSKQCREPEGRFFHNFTSKICEPFRFYGCPGNENSHPTIKECEEACVPPDLCQMPPDHGSCKEKIQQRWFYNPKTKRCKRFTFKGCKVNAHNFKTRLECQEKCPKGDVCTLPPEPGPCKKMQRWFYEPKNKMCKKFTYKGCTGNASHFKTRAECQQKCPKRGTH